MRQLGIDRACPCETASKAGSIIRERQREGIELAKRRGTYKGRAPALSADAQADLVAKVKAGGINAALMAEFRVSKATFYRYLNAHTLALAR